MTFADVIFTALQQLRENKLRSFFTLLGIIVSVAFLVAVVAIISGMNAYVKENLASALIGANTFQVRRSPIRIGLFDDETYRRIAKRPIITGSDAAAVIAAVPQAVAVSMQSGFPTPIADIQYGTNTLGNVSVYGVTAPYQVVQDYVFSSGRPLTDVDVSERRNVVVIGADVATSCSKTSTQSATTFEYSDDISRSSESSQRKVSCSANRSTDSYFFR